MQIDVLSSNTLKLTLSRLDMSDLDIKYECLSSRNPETKRLLANVLKSVRVSEKSGFDFSGERLFVEAFPRPDGGCMLYISCLENIENQEKSHFAPISVFKPKPNPETKRKARRKSSENFPEKLTENAVFICKVEGINQLESLCRSLCNQSKQGRMNFESALYLSDKDKKYRLLIISDNPQLISGIAREYGELYKYGNQFNNELNFTREHCRLLAEEKAAEKLA